MKVGYLAPTGEPFARAALSPESQVHSTSRPLPPPVDEGQSEFPNFGNYPFSQGQPSGDIQNTVGLKVFTVSHFAPRHEDSDESDLDEIQPPPNLPILKDQEERPPHSVHVRRKTFVPGWAVPPKILLVDDDVVYRNMSSKLLQVFGCEADVAVDGFSALDKVNMEKYDLILMDVVMPNLDGISATNMIRQFDVATPIISMTSNIHSNDIINYFKSGTSFSRKLVDVGMNDVLPKPFTKDSLLEMLEKHLLHMKEMQEMGYPIPAPIKDEQIVDLPAESQTDGDPIPSASHFQFSYDQDYTGAFGPPADGTATYPALPQHLTPHTTTRKRRTASENDPYEYLDQSRTVPRSAGRDGQAPGKRARYNTPPW
jgi:CheY-like chemotaxis protein